MDKKDWKKIYKEKLKLAKIIEENTYPIYHDIIIQEKKEKAKILKTK